MAIFFVIIIAACIVTMSMVVPALAQRHWHGNKLTGEQKRCQVCGTDNQMILMYDEDIDYPSLCHNHFKFIHKIKRLEQELLDTKPVTKSYGYKGSLQQKIDEQERKTDYVSIRNIRMSYKNFLGLYEDERRSLMRGVENVYVGPNPPQMTVPTESLWIKTEAGQVAPSAANPLLITYIER